MHSQHCWVKNMTPFLSLLPLMKLEQIRTVGADMQAVSSTGPKINVCETEGEKKIFSELTINCEET